ncbi:MAG: hypothetical protein IKX30_07855 [Victivallales bacterium]|nr:hypothetical protein [Victivallales bacterium]
MWYYRVLAAATPLRRRDAAATPRLRMIIRGHCPRATARTPPPHHTDDGTPSLPPVTYYRGGSSLAWTAFV